MSEGSVTVARLFTIRRAGLQRPARARPRRCRAENRTMTSKPRGCVADRVERWSVSPEVDGQALSLASQLPQVPISNKQPCAGKAACGSGLARDSGGKALTRGDSSNAGLSALKWMNRPYRWQASSHRYSFQAGSPMPAKPPVGDSMVSASANVGPGGPNRGTGAAPTPVAPPRHGRPLRSLCAGLPAIAVVKR